MRALEDYMQVTGQNQTALAKRIGVSPMQLNHWLAGRRSPSAENLKLISERTGITLDNLLRDLKIPDKAD